VFGTAITVRIDETLCTGCGACVAVCPTRSLAMRGGTAVVVGTTSLHCCHCEAACPVGAVSNAGADAEAGRFATFEADRRWLPHGQGDLPGLVRLMASRRSCRNYGPTPVSRDQLRDLVKIAVTAPSGTNSQRWTFTVVPTRQRMLDLGAEIRAFFIRLNRLAAAPVLRTLLRLVGRPELDQYRRRYYRTIADGIAEFERTGVDRLWHGATAAVVIATAPGASCPAEDALLAAQNMQLAAHAMGLGTCLIGFAVAAMQKEPAIQKGLGIPDDERVHAVVALGHPAETYHRCAGRRMPEVRWVGEGGTQ